MARRPLARVGLTGVEAATPNDDALARALAARFDVPVRDARDRAADGVRVIAGADGLALAFEDRARGKPFRPQLSLPRPLSRADNLRRALGTGERVIDATAGFGGDTVRMLSLGKRVTAIERSPVVFAVLEDAVRRGRAGGGAVGELLGELSLRHADACDVLSEIDADVVYLDAMFTKPKRTAKSPKEMQLLQELLGPTQDIDNDRLLSAALSSLANRVVIKRPLKAVTPGAIPTFRALGQSVRYDIFVRERCSSQGS